nr:unnamed protein product [Callosobruchus analis]
MEDPAFIKTVADKAAEAIAKTNVADLNINFGNNLKDIKNQLAVLKRHKLLMEQNYDNLDQQSRRNAIRIFNFVEKDHENTREEVINLINSKMSMNLDSKDVEVCYRIGKKEGDGKPRGIYLKLKTQETKMEIYRKKGNKDIVEYLLSKDADPFVKDSDGKTALHKAAENGHLHVCRILLSVAEKLKDIEDNRGNKANVDSILL